MRLDTVLYTTMETLRVCAILLLPVMPTSAATVLEHLGVKPERWTAAQAATAFERRPGEPLALKKKIKVFEKV